MTFNPDLKVTELLLMPSVIRIVCTAIDLFLWFAERPDVAMIRCSNDMCHLGTWFHLDCAAVDVVPDDDWWCSDECRQTERSIFCSCHKIRNEPRVTCANADCSSGSIYHLDCVNLKQQPGLRREG